MGIREFRFMNWLPMKKRCEQCNATSVFKLFDNSTPPYMSEVFLPVGQSWLLEHEKQIKPTFQKELQGAKWPLLPRT